MPQSECLLFQKTHQRPFELSQRWIWPGWLEIEIEGELDFLACEQLRAALEGAALRDGHVAIGFDSCDFIDSSGLAVLVAAGRALSARDRRLLLYGVHGQVRRVLELVGRSQDGVLLLGGDARDSSPSLEVILDEGFKVTLSEGDGMRRQPASAPKRSPAGARAAG